VFSQPLGNLSQARFFSVGVYYIYLFTWSYLYFRLPLYRLRKMQASHSFCLHPETTHILNVISFCIQHGPCVL